MNKHIFVAVFGLLQLINPCYYDVDRNGDRKEYRNRFVHFIKVFKFENTYIHNTIVVCSC